MALHSKHYDALVIGGGFYGVAISLYLAKNRKLKKILLVEREPELLNRASFKNQARVHTGYHYPRSLTTGYRSRVNLPRFLRDWPTIIKRDFTNLYAIARTNSKVSSQQFRKFCSKIGAQLTPAPSQLSALFEPRLIEDVFITEEYVFDANHLATLARKDLL